ncbi:MAG: hypothetical protein NC307_15700 [Roseburia sp.]|nr:hypothetical protein [Roseburia sp.]
MSENLRYNRLTLRVSEYLDFLCGGTGGGETLCFWYDSRESRLLPGRTSWYGGGTYGSDAEVYDWMEGECQRRILFTVRDTVSGQSYGVNGEFVTKEQYEEEKNRYTRVDIPF